MAEAELGLSVDSEREADGGTTLPVRWSVEVRLFYCVEVRPMEMAGVDGDRRGKKIGRLLKLRRTALLRCGLMEVRWGEAVLCGEHGYVRVDWLEKRRKMTGCL